MARVKSRDTEPEKIARRLLSSLSVRYRLHRKDIPGCPDLYIPRLGLAIFVNGCFWHGHGCKRSTRPKSNRQFWAEKLDRNIDRDRRVEGRLDEMGLTKALLWTCEKGKWAKQCRSIAKKYHFIGRKR